jgi:hypothetical protein
VLGAAAALVGRELAVGVDLVLEALEELLTGRAGAGASVVVRLHEISAAIRLLMSLAAMGRHRPESYAV